MHLPPIPFYFPLPLITFGDREQFIALAALEVQCTFCHFRVIIGEGFRAALLHFDLPPDNVHRASSLRGGSDSKEKLKVTERTVRLF